MRVRSAYKNKIKRKRNHKSLLWIFFILFFIGIAVYFIIFSRVFKIKNIDIQTSEKISPEEASIKVNNFLEKKVLIFIPGNNYFVFSENKLAGFLHNEIKATKKILVIKDFPARLRVNVSGRVKFMTYCHDTRCFDIDEEGVIFEETPVIFGGANIVVEDLSSRDIKLGERILEPELLSHIAKANKIISENINLSLLKFEINSNPVADITAVSSEGWKIILDPYSDYSVQISALMQVLEEKIKDQRQTLEYVDLRVAGRVYYKLK